MKSLKHQIAYMYLHFQSKIQLDHPVVSTAKIVRLHLQIK